MLKVGGKSSIGSRYQACVNAANNKGVTLFGLDDKRCWTSQNAYASYSKYGTSGTCKKAKNGELEGGLSESGSVYVYQRDQDGKPAFHVHCKQL